jgi:hypothetical protein
MGASKTQRRRNMNTTRTTQERLIFSDTPMFNIPPCIDLTNDVRKIIDLTVDERPVIPPVPRGSSEVGRQYRCDGFDYSLPTAPLFEVVGPDG